MTYLKLDPLWPCCCCYLRRMRCCCCRKCKTCRLLLRTVARKLFAPAGTEAGPKGATRQGRSTDQAPSAQILVGLYQCADKLWPSLSEVGWSGRLRGVGETRISLSGFEPTNTFQHKYCCDAVTKLLCSTFSPITHPCSTFPLAMPKPALPVTRTFLDQGESVHGYLALRTFASSRRLPSSSSDSSGRAKIWTAVRSLDRFSSGGS